MPQALMSDLSHTWRTDFDVSHPQAMDLESDVRLLHIVW